MSRGEEKYMSTLVTYFSAEAGTTARIAKDLAAKLGAASVDAKLVRSADEL